MEKTNILLLSAGTRNKIVEYFKKELKGKGSVIAADCSSLAPALYEADKYYIVPKIKDENYIYEIMDICEKEKVRGVLSLIDPELSLLAKQKVAFKELGVEIIGSSFELCETAMDKWKTYLWLKEHSYHCAQSYREVQSFERDLKKRAIAFPIFLKPRRGSASVAVSKVDDMNMVRLLMQENKELMIQEYLDGQEIGADCYIDLLSGQVISIFLKKKIVMRAGETDKAVSFKDEKLFELIKKFVSEMGYRGPVDIDIFQVGEEYYISEINPRFGGGYPHAYECGANYMEFILNNLNGWENTPVLGQYEEGIFMMKYSEIKTASLINREGLEKK